MTTIVFYSDTPKEVGGLFGSPSNGLKFAAGTFSFDSSYPTGGEDITTIFDLFNDPSGTSNLMGILIRDPTASAGTGKKCVVSYTTKKLLLYTNASPPVEVSDTSDQSGASSLRWLAWGTR